jgi:hypothetical protein
MIDGNLAKALSQNNLFPTRMWWSYGHGTTYQHHNLLLKMGF